MREKMNRVANGILKKGQEDLRFSVYTYDTEADYSGNAILRAKFRFQDDAEFFTVKIREIEDLYRLEITDEQDNVLMEWEGI